MIWSWYNFVMLGAESQQVVWLRLIKLGTGGSNACDEAWLMVSEKLIASTRATESVMLGKSADAVVQSYRSHVRANMRRLS